MSYDLLSGHYDELVRFDYDAYLKHIESHLPQGGSALDVCAGTGTFSLMLAGKGFKVTCVDNSANMLTAAAKKARAARRNLLMLKSDVNDLKIYGKYNLVVSTCDGLNYVKSVQKLTEVVGKIYDALADDGVFVFDVSTQSKAKNVLSGQTFFEDTPSYTLFWTAEPLEDGKIGTDVSVFTKTGDVYAREDGFFVQYFYDNETYLQILKDAGFCVEVWDGETFGKLAQSSNRMLVIARK